MVRFANRELCTIAAVVLLQLLGTTFTRPAEAAAATAATATAAASAESASTTAQPTATSSRGPTTINPVQRIHLPTYQPPQLVQAAGSRTAETEATTARRTPEFGANESDQLIAASVLANNAINSAKVQPLKRATGPVSSTAPPPPASGTAKRSGSSVQSIPSNKTPPATSPNAISSAAKDDQRAVAVKSVRGTAPTDAYECPKDEYFQLFPTRCSKHSECHPRNGDEFRCCKQIGGRRCVKAVARPVPEPKHEPILGVIPRKCPREPLAELFWDLQTCETDRDCWPRVCCPDGAHKYCRTAQPELEKSSLTVARQLSTPLESVSRYIQCTPPPPAIFDQFPKKCNSTLDCFPNVCCQEAGRKHCRPPRRSLLSLLTGFASRFNTGIIRQWTQNIVIR